MHTRRDVLKAGIGLVIGIHAAGCARLSEDSIEGAGVRFNAFIRIAPDNTVTVISKYTELGQGIYSGLATIVAEELDADWSQMRVEAAPADVELYPNPILSKLIKPIQATGGSLSMMGAWEETRKAAASARAMLATAAAERWKVPAQEITIDSGSVRHAKSGRAAGFGELVARAAKVALPASVVPKEPKDFRLIGRPLPRLDTRDKCNGQVQYTIDVQQPNMLTALVAHAPRFGGVVAKLDDTLARKVPDVVNVVKIPTGVAVVAHSFWSAKRGREALQITWDDSKAEMRSTHQIMAEYRALVSQPGAAARTVGDTDAAMARVAKKLTASFEFPYLAHATMEPLDCVVKLTSTACEMWSGTQSQSIDQQAAADYTGLTLQQVKIHTQFAGGGFGRRGALDQPDCHLEAVAIAKAMGADGRPIKLLWTREDDMRGGRYRPMVFQRIAAGLDANGTVLAWRQEIVGQAHLTAGAVDSPYVIPNVSVTTRTAKSPVTTHFWRAVDNTHTAFAIETFIDEVAHSIGADPVRLREQLLQGRTRELAVLKLAAEKAGWGEHLPRGRGRGIALHNTFGTAVAQVADVTVVGDAIKVDRVVCAVDCGVVVNPDVVRAQVEGGIAFGLGAALFSQITLKDGQVEQSNFHDYRVLRMAEMPHVDVYIIPSAQSPSGIGEPPVSPIAPAVANAVFDAIGKRCRSLPLMPLRV